MMYCRWLSCSHLGNWAYSYHFIEYEGVKLLIYYSIDIWLSWYVLRDVLWNLRYDNVLWNMTMFCETWDMLITYSDINIDARHVIQQFLPISCIHILFNMRVKFGVENVAWFYFDLGHLWRQMQDPWSKRNCCWKVYVLPHRVRRNYTQNQMVVVASIISPHANKSHKTLRYLASN
jgi:hypothetical protein